MIGGFMSVTGLLVAILASIAFLVAIICYFKLFFGIAHSREEAGFGFLFNFKNRGNELKILVVFWLAVLVCSTSIWYFTTYLEPNGKGFKTATSMAQIKSKLRFL